ncbi:MAG TPA: ABC transporter permease [Candidatus Limnocylindrales bacterium]|nr:ABC transporter permease [Candidatus Limnocylindrales bacterium]
MNFGARMRSWLSAIFERSRVESEMDAELHSHLEIYVDDLVRTGVARDEALRRARLEFGGVERAKEECREARGIHFLESLGQDARYGLRTFRKPPGFAAVAILTLALGIGANAAIFSVVNAVLLRPLPFEKPGQLMALWHTPPQESFPGVPKFAVSPANFLDWRAQSRLFEGMSAFGYGRYTITGTGRPETIRMVAATRGFFSILRAQPLLGRTFADEEDNPGREHVVVLGYGMWRSRYAGDPAIVGKNIELNGQLFAVIGVMPPGFDFPPSGDPAFRTQMWKPLAWSDRERGVRDNHNFGVIARLKDGVTLKQGQAELDAISSRLAQQYPKDNKGWGALVVPMREELVGDARPALLILLGCVAFVLLIACANVANLLLARSLSRRKEIAVRAALGAGRRRLLQQALAETLLLALAGGALGLLFAHYGVILIVKFLAERLPRADEIGLDVWVLAFTLGVSLLTGILAGILPALRQAKTDLNLALKEGPGRAASDSAGNRTRSALVVAEVALSLMLLIAAGLLIRSLAMLRNVNPGFDPNHVVTMQITIPSTKFATPLQQVQFYDRVLERVRALPGVQSAGVIDDLPLNEEGSMQPISIEGRPVVPMADMPEVSVRVISSGYLRAMRIPLVRGRDINDSDAEARSGGILISESLAKQFWPNEDAIGKRLTLYFSPHLTREVVGIVSDVKLFALSDNRPAPALYIPMAQLAPPEGGEWQSFSMSLVVRADGNPVNTVPVISSVIHELDAEVPLLGIQTMNDAMALSLAPQRFTMLLLAAFAGLALLLAAVGIYSVMSYSVSRRTHEIGIRISLGAKSVDVLLLVVRQGLLLAMAGSAIGIIGALILSRLLATLLYGVRPTDALTFVSVACLLMMVALSACLVPARRALCVDPMVALRYE